MDRRKDQQADGNHSQENLGGGEPNQGGGGHSEAANEAADSVKPKATWEYKTEFAINTRMKEILKMTLVAAQAERDRLKKKLDKLQYGG
jgi:hypothetical protein